MAKETSMEEVGAIFQVCWATCKARNATVFRGKPPIPEEVIDNAKVANRDYVQAMFMGSKASTPLHAPDTRRSPPNSFVTKFNTGAYKSSRSLTAFGVITRDSGWISSFMACWQNFGFFGHFGGSLDPLYCLPHCSGIDCWKAVFESDCLELINCFKDPKSLCPWEIRAVVMT